MQFKIKKKFSDSIRWTVELDDEYKNTLHSTQLGEAVKTAIKSNKNLRLAGLEGANLEGASLKGANLESANLVFANLKGANLEGAKLVFANLKGANLEDAYLEDAYLEGACLESAKLVFANLEGAGLEGANLEGASLKGANLEGANLVFANLKGANLEGANLKGANLVFAYLEGAYLKGAIYNSGTVFSNNFKPENQDMTKEYKGFPETAKDHKLVNNVLNKIRTILKDDNVSIENTQIIINMMQETVDTNGGKEYTDFIKLIP